MARADARRRLLSEWIFWFRILQIGVLAQLVDGAGVQRKAGLWVERAERRAAPAFDGGGTSGTSLCRIGAAMLQSHA